MVSPSKNNRHFVRKLRLQDQGTDDLLLHLTAAERLKMVWPITLDCWAFLPGNDAEREFQRHVERVERRGR